MRVHRRHPARHAHEEGHGLQQLARGGPPNTLLLCAFCTFTFMDQNFDIFRHAPSEFHAFHRVAKLVPPEPFWGTFDFILSRYKGGARFYEILQMMRKAIAVVISVFLSKHSIEVQAMAMLLMVLISFILHIRLRPYDDQNSSVRMNSLY